MTRFLLGLLAGAAAFALTWVVAHNTGWAALAAITVSVLVWFGEFILDDLL
jgi:hypothetical protein